MKRTRAVLVAPKQFDFVQEEIPKLKENEVLYKTISVGLCHSDIRTVEPAQWDSAINMVMMQ